MFSLLLSIIVTATIDSTTIFLGDQTDLHLQAVVDAETRVQLPVYGETLIPDIEIVDRSQIDSVRMDDGKLQLNQILTVTSFKDSLFSIPAIPFVVGSDTFFSDPMSLNVIQPFEVDSTMAITDIKDIYRAPVWWWGIIRWILLGLLLAGLGVGGYFAWKKWGYLLVGKKEEEPIAPELLRPAEEVALEKLDIIKAEKIWQGGQVKEYHTQLTDVVREYIARRFDVSSSEKTSDETLRDLKPLLNGQKDLYSQLKKMLCLADLVKFAKWTTTPDENESSLLIAYDFVHQTTPVPTEENEGAEEPAKEPTKEPTK